MSQEHHHSSNERNERDQVDLEKARNEKLAELHQKSEKSPDDSPERARIARETINKPEHTPEPPPAVEADRSASPSIPLLDYKLNYTQTVASMQRHLKPVSRTFSKVIHIPAIEKASEALENTVARPSLTAGATWTALIMGSLFYFTARHYGYVLSGSEITLSFIVGAIIGLALEAAWRSAFRRRH